MADIICSCFRLSQASRQSVVLLLWEERLCHFQCSCLVHIIVSWSSFWLFWELSRNSTSSFLVSISQSWAVVVLDFWSGVTAAGDVCIATSNICVCSSLLAFWVVSVVQFLFLLTSSWLSTDTTGGCCQATSGIGGSLVYSVISGLPDAVAKWRRGVFNLEIGAKPGH